MQILVDGDACPVVQEVLGIAREFKAPVKVLSSLNHYSEDSVETVFVDNGFQSVDIKIANMVGEQDIVVTDDYGLAALCIGRGAAVITSRGIVLDESSIQEVLFKRYLGAKIRRGGGRTKGPRSLSQDDRKLFAKKLQELVGERRLYTDKD